MNRIALWVVCTSLAATSANGAEFLERLESPVHDAPGTPQELARKAVVCIGQLVKSNAETISDRAPRTPFAPAPVIVSQDIEAGRVVANSVVPGATRSTLTFEAKPDRFRIVQTGIETYIAPSPFAVFPGWYPVRRAKPPKVAFIERQLIEVADKVAACVKAPAADW